MVKQAGAPSWGCRGIPGRGAAWLHVYFKTALCLGDGERGGLEAERVTLGQAHLLMCGLGHPHQTHGKGRK